MAEDVNVEEEKGQGADAQQTFDGLTPLVDTITPLAAADVLRAGDGSLDWEEPLASQSLTTIHTGCRPTDIDLMAKLMPEGEDIIGSEEITVAEQGSEAELADVEPSKIAIDPDDRPASEAEQARGAELQQPDQDLPAPPENPAEPKGNTTDEIEVAPATRTEATIDGGNGNDQIGGVEGADVIDGGTRNDHVMGGAGDYLFIFGAGDGADYLAGGDGWSDAVQLDGVDGGSGAGAGRALQADEGVDYTETESGIEKNTGVITLDDGNELTFDSVEKLEW